MKSNKKKRMVITLLIVGIIMYIGFKVINKDENVKYLENENKGIYEYNISGIDINKLEEDLFIKRINYNWEKTLTGLNNPKLIVFHHADASIMSPEEVNEIHKEKGWDGIGYHYYIRKDGTIYAGRPEEIMGSHVYGDNKDTLGICLEGDFQEEKPTEEEKDSLVDLCVYLILKYNITECEGHKKFYNTLCPGELFPEKEIKERISSKLLRYFDEGK